jgi:hypothetical protein
MSFPIKPLSNETNREIWTKFESQMRDNLAAKGGKTPPDMIVAQTRSAVTRFEAVCNNWQNVTPEIIEQVKNSLPVASQVLLNSFLTTIILNGWLVVSNESMLVILPKDWREFVSIMLAK